MPENTSKNVAGDFSNVGTVKIGDETHHHHHSTAPPPKNLTLDIPTMDADQIIGRDKDLDELRGLLQSKQNALLINGLGGIGKTTLAQVYTSKYWQDYQHVAWITQSSDNFLLDFISTTGLKKSLGIGEDRSDPSDIFNEIILRFNAIKNRPNLLILDNVNEDIEKVRHALPKAPEWHILLTSRTELHGFAIKMLDFLNKEEAFLLFKKYYFRSEITDEQIHELIETVDCHTLTIEILAKTATYQRYSFGRLKNALTQDEKANVKIARPGSDKIEKITSFLCSIFSLSNLNEDEKWLMRQMICLPSEFHTYQFLQQLISPETAQKEEVFAQTLQELSQKAWLLKNTDTDSYKMHLVISEVVKRQLPVRIQDIDSLLKNITRLLRIDQSKDNPVDKFQWIPYGKAIISAVEHQSGVTQENENDLSVLENNLALVLQELGDYEGAKKLLQKAMISDEKNFGEEHPSTAASYSNLATVLKDLGDYEGAKKLLQKAMISAEKNFGEEHPTTAVSYSNLATVLQDLGDYEGAKKLLQKAMISTEKNFGEEHPSTAVRYSNLALVLKALGDYEGAKKLLQKAMISDEKNFGEEHPATARRYSNLALVLQDLGDYEGAKKLLQKAMISAEKNFGEEHPSTAVSYSNLATVYYNTGDLDKALEFITKAHKVYINHLGAEHPNTKIIKGNLDIIQQQLNK